MERERDWFRKEALELDKMNKDHKRVLAELKARLEAVSEDKEFMHTQLINQKQTNRGLMMELDQYRDKHGDIDAFKGIGSKTTGFTFPPSPKQIQKGTENIFDPTALPENLENSQSRVESSMVAQSERDPEVQAVINQAKSKY